MGSRICPGDPFCGTQVKWPATFEMKVFMEGSVNPPVAQTAITGICKALNVPCGTFSSRASSGGAYYCLTLPVTVDSKETLDHLYEKLRLVPGVKTVI